MAKDVRYWDANCFSGFLNGEADKVADCDSVLQAAIDGHVLIVTSALTLAEVLFIKGGPKLDPSKRQKIDMFFKADYISVQNVTRFEGELARDVYWDHAIKPKDAVHIATAALRKLPMFNTFDGDLIQKSGLIVNGHTLTIEKPHLPQQLGLENLDVEEQ
jgi:predicted nucleic acid-binding protein